MATELRLFHLKPPVIGALILLAVAVVTLPMAQANPALCEAAARKAAARTGVPYDVLMAISLTETGRKRDGRFQVWPWTVNMEGKGVWFDDPDSAKAYVYENYKRGARSFDVGCFQINYKWHGQNFASIEEMFQPEPNALYAARFLADLYREKGSWSAAAGAYHSRTKTHADRYAGIFDRHLARLSGGTPQPAPAATPVTLVQRVNLYPLLKPGATQAGMGSLMPLQPTGQGSLLRRGGAG